MHWIDWTIAAAVVTVLVMLAFWTKQYTRSVADFLAANRCAGRYVLTMAQGMASIGAVGILGSFEQFYNSGFGAAWWGMMFIPIVMIITLSGWLIYRYRETRAMTLGQFFEIRYSKKFRIFAGMLAWFSGVLNYGVYPGIAARFLIYFCQIPQYVISVGPLELNVTLGVIMAFLLLLAVLFTFWGGQIAVIVTDFFQGQFVNIVFVMLLVFIFMKVNWSTIIETLKMAPAGESMLNPFDQKNIPAFTFSYFALQVFFCFYAFMAWQGAQGNNCAAKSPHEARMSRVIASWRTGVIGMMLMVLPICAYVIFHNSSFDHDAAKIKAVLQGIADPTLRQSMTVPVTLAKILPLGLAGLFCAVVITASVSTDNAYLHSWGSILIQDVIIPLRGHDKPLSTEMHLKYLRLSILGVAVFVWIFSMLFPLRDFILMFLALTSAIYIGGAGSVIIGGLYWKRSTTAGAWSAMIVGAVVALGGLVLKNVIWPVIANMIESGSTLLWIRRVPKEFPLDGMELSFISAVCAVVAFIFVSLITKPDPDFSMDRMLHRGKYSIDGEHQDTGIALKRGQKLLGISKEFTWFDKFIYFGTMAYSVVWFLIFIAGLICYLFFKISDNVWAKFWLANLVINGIIGIVAVIWFLWGGFYDMRDMFKSLTNNLRNSKDDGSVIKQNEIIRTDCKSQSDLKSADTESTENRVYNK